ncbi:MAG: response regulator [Desulforhabdus sp.]|jgi:DNA-binding NtrC family response regulator|nr:response regulator [Desulforhabdus sp.]
MAIPRILIVDDEERFRTTLGKRLAERKLDVTTVGSGLEAIEEVKNKHFDVIVLDAKMPGLDGIETLSEIKKLNPGIEVLLLTGHASVDSAVDGMRLGAFDYILKPCDIDQLLEKIYEAYSLKEARDERIRQAEIRKMIDRRSS